MAKIRGIKPEFWVDESLVVCTAWARLFYIGLWNFADDRGIFEWEPKRLKMLVLPADNIDTSKLLAELVKCGKLIKFKHQNKYYGIIKNFEKHQKTDKRFFREILPGLDLGSIKPLQETTTRPPRDHAADIDSEVEGEGDIDSEVDTPTEVLAKPEPKKENLKVTNMLLALRQMVGVPAFADSKNERFMAKHCIDLVDKIGAEEFRRRLTLLLKDDFKRKNCNRIKYLYGELKSWIEPVQKKKAIIL